MRLLESRIRPNLSINQVICIKSYSTSLSCVRTTVFYHSTSNTSNATFSDSTSHSTRLKMPNPRQFYVSHSTFSEFLQTGRIPASSMWNLTLRGKVQQHSCVCRKRKNRVFKSSHASHSNISKSCQFPSSSLFP